VKRSLARPLVVIALLLGATGCGGEDPASTGALADLVDRVATSGNDRSVLAVDFAAARAALSLSDDADPSAGFGGNESERRFTAAAAAMPHLARPRKSAMHDAIDAGRVSAAATNSALGKGSLTVVRTGQDFDEIADALAGAGFERDGDVLTYTGDERLSSGPLYSHVAGRKGLVAMTSDITGDEGAETVRRALGDVPSSESGKLAAELSGPGQAVVRVGNECVRAMTIVDPFDGNDAHLTLVAQSDISTVEFVGDRSGTLGSFRFGTPERVEDQLRIPVQEAPANASPLRLVTGDLTQGDLWKCS
jgi:hypothetical protein